MQFTNRGSKTGWARHAIVAIALGLFMAFLGPFGSESSMSAGGRTVFWLCLVGTGYLLALAASLLIVERPRRSVLQAIARASLSALPQTFIVSWALVQIRPGRLITLANLPMLFLAVLAVQLVIVAVQSWKPAATQEIESASVTDGAAVPQARGRIAQSLRDDLVALEAEDHYVRIHHRSGSTLLLHRLSDAVAELDGRDGLQVHRSWWVASEAVAGTFVRGGKRWLKLLNGMEIPVSRTHLRRVIEQGWPRLDMPTAGRG